MVARISKRKKNGKRNYVGVCKGKKREEKNVRGVD
jgi:hypothetical protein